MTKNRCSKKKTKKKGGAKKGPVHTYLWWV